MLLPSNLVLNFLCIQTFSQIFQYLVQQRKYDFIAIWYDGNVSGVDEIFALNKNLSVDWVVASQTTRLHQPKYKDMWRAKKNPFLLFVCDGGNSKNIPMIGLNGLNFKFFHLFTASSKAREATLINGVKINTHANVTTTVMFCNENNTYSYYYVNQQRMAQLSPIDVSDHENPSDKIYTAMYKNYVYKIKLSASIGYPRICVHNNSDGIMQLHGSEIYVMNSLKNHMKFETTCQWLEHGIPHRFVSHNMRNVYKEIWANNLVDNSSTNILYTHSSVILPTPIFNTMTMWYDSANLIILVAENAEAEDSLEMHASALWMIIIMLSAILIFLARKVTQITEISLPEASLRSLSAVLGTGNVGWKKTAHRSEKIFLFAFIIFGLFFNTYYTGELFAIRVLSSNRETFKTLNDLLESKVLVFYELYLFPVLYSTINPDMESVKIMNISIMPRCVYEILKLKIRVFREHFFTPLFS